MVLVVPPLPSVVKPLVLLLPRLLAVLVVLPSPVVVTVAKVALVVMVELVV